MTEPHNTGTGVQTKTVTEDENNIRLDKWFLSHFPGLSKTQLYKLMRKGQVRLDGKRVKPDARVMAGQSVRVPPMPAEAYETRKPKPSYSREEADRDRALLKQITLYQDADVLILNKPHGLATQGGSKVKRHINGILRSITSNRCTPHIVHRLDRDTSGVLVIAKNAKSARTLGEVFKHRRVQKYYWALLSPAPEMEDGIIEAKIAKGKTRGGERVMVDHENGKYSKSEFWVIEKAYTKAAWVCFKPETGRTHQLRVHAQLIGCPIVGDKKYAETDRHIEMPVDLQDIPSAQKLHLHAQRLVLPHPSGTGELDITAPLPDHMQKTFKYFEFDLNNADRDFE